MAGLTGFETVLPTRLGPRAEVVYGGETQGQWFEAPQLNLIIDLLSWFTRVASQTDNRSAGGVLGES